MNKLLRRGAGVACQAGAPVLIGRPFMTPDPDAKARRVLSRHRAAASSLLALMAALVLASRLLPDMAASRLLQAAASAGLVGGLADWFAVTALFRRPLGLPIPHTAILPTEKARLGQALGNFVANHVFTETEVARTLGRLDLPGIIARFLADPEAARPAARGVAAMLPRLLATIEDGRARRLLARLAPRLLAGSGPGLLARVLRALVEGGRHQEVFGFVLAQFKETINAKEEQLRQAIEERVREQGGRLIGWALGASIARRVLSAMNAELDKMGPDGSELRLAFDEWIRREIERLEDGPARAEEIAATFRRVLTHATVQAWLWDIWARLRLALEADAANPAGRTVNFLAEQLGALGARLAADPKSRAAVSRAAERAVAALLPSARIELARFIAEVVGGWDSATLTTRLELRIGKDLQYIRINGTLVGFLAGGALHLVINNLFGSH